ncbi:HU family DNA-binding protein [Loktanella sp. S4079]|uniref:HU family DNA-binding protein n=1 Tax=Loktanella sp. S4079 TaxID=579483 RepID=UPI000695FB96|nr:HU family DNA-binding protein [Loktanella sp. S4079]
MSETEDQNEAPENVLKKPALFEEVVARTGLKKRDVKPAVEAALAVLGEALERGEDLNIPPLGKLRIVKAKDLTQGGKVMTAKIRTPKQRTES